MIGETRRLNVYVPPVYRDSATIKLPVLYIPDGGLAEDFLHVAGLVQVSVGNGTMRPFILVGIENTERRRDLTGPISNEQDKKIAPRVGGSAAFRRFIRTELMPAIRQRYRTTPETAVVGESLAGLFVVETLLQEPDLFDTYLAFDPSLWWNNEQLVGQADKLLEAYAGPGKTLFLSASSQPNIADETRRLAATHRGQPAPDLALRATAPGNARYHLPAGRAARFSHGVQVQWAPLAPKALMPRELSNQLSSRGIIIYV